MVRTHGLSESKMSPLADQTITNLQLFVESITQEIVELQKSLKECQLQLSNLQTNCKRMQTEVLNKQFQRHWEFARIRRQTVVPKKAEEYLQFWGSTKDEASHCCKCLGVELTEILELLSPDDWEPGGDIDVLD